MKKFTDLNIGNSTEIQVLNKVLKLKNEKITASMIRNKGHKYFIGRPLIIDNGDHYSMFNVYYVPVMVGYNSILRKCIFSNIRTKEVAEYMRVCRTIKAIKAEL